MPDASRSRSNVYFVLFEGGAIGLADGIAALNKRRQKSSAKPVKKTVMKVLDSDGQTLQKEAAKIKFLGERELQRQTVEIFVHRRLTAANYTHDYKIVAAKSHGRVDNLEGLTLVIDKVAKDKGSKSFCRYPAGPSMVKTRAGIKNLLTKSSAQICVGVEKLGSLTVSKSMMKNALSTVVAKYKEVWKLKEEHIPDYIESMQLRIRTLLKVYKENAMRRDRCAPRWIHDMRSLGEGTVDSEGDDTADAETSRVAETSGSAGAYGGKIVPPKRRKITEKKAHAPKKKAGATRAAPSPKADVPTKKKVKTGAAEKAQDATVKSGGDMQAARKKRGKSAGKGDEQLEPQNEPNSKSSSSMLPKVVASAPDSGNSTEPTVVATPPSETQSPRNDSGPTKRPVCLPGASFLDTLL